MNNSGLNQKNATNTQHDIYNSKNICYVTTYFHNSFTQTQIKPIYELWNIQHLIALILTGYSAIN